jgi:hypothetical protein
MKEILLYETWAKDWKPTACPVCGNIAMSYGQIFTQILPLPPQTDDRRPIGEQWAHDDGTTCSTLK